MRLWMAENWAAAIAWCCEDSFLTTPLGSPPRLGEEVALKPGILWLASSSYSLLLFYRQLERQYLQGKSSAPPSTVHEPTFCVLSNNTTLSELEGFLGTDLALFPLPLAHFMEEAGRC